MGGSEGVQRLRHGLCLAQDRATLHGTTTTIEEWANKECSRHGYLHDEVVLLLEELL